MQGSPLAGDGPLAVALRACAARVVRRAVKRARGDLDNSALALGISRRALQYHLDRYGLTAYAATLRAEAGTGGQAPPDDPEKVA